MAKSRFDMARNFLATDEVPETIFGVPVVQNEADYSKGDRRFFREHPEAGGYYSTGEEAGEAGEAGEAPEPQGAVKAGDSSSEYDTPVPDGLRPAYDSWYGQLPKNLQYTRDYDLQGAWLERLGRPAKYEATQSGHLDDYGKKPNHPTFSSGSKWHDPKVPGRTGGEWKKSQDGTWDFYPGTGNTLTDDQLKEYFDRYEKGNRVHRGVRQDAKGGQSAEDAEYARVTNAMSEVIPFIKEHEGFRGKAYQDSVGKWTIGYGQTEIGGRPVAKGDVIDEKAASKFVEQRVHDNTLRLREDHPDWSVNLSKGALAALYDVAYNAGTEALSLKKSPTLHRELASADMDHDSIVWGQIPTYVTAGGKKLKGLVDRRQDAINKWRM